MIGEEENYSGFCGFVTTIQVHGPSYDSLSHDVEPEFVESRLALLAALAVIIACREHVAWADYGCPRRILTA